MELGRDEKRILLLTLLSIIIIAGLYTNSIFLQPERVEIGNLGKHVGEYVEVEGIVKYYKNTTKGTLVEICDMNGENETYLFLLFHSVQIPGSVIRARGMVQIYQGMLEIVVKDEGEIETLKRSLEVGLEELLSNPEFFVDMRIRVYGNLSHLYPAVDENQMQITDGINTTWVHIPFRYFGERDVYLYGTVINGTLYVENITLQYSGDVVSIGDIRQYEGKRIWVHATILAYQRLYGYYGWLRSGDYALKVFLKEKVDEGFCYLEGRFVYNEKNGQYELMVE